MPSQTVILAVILIGAGILYWYWNSKKEGGGGGATRGRSMIEAYTRDLTKDAEAKKLDPVIGREEEIERTIHILSRRSKNNPLILGEPGVGKTAIVEGIARRIAANNIPDTLKGKRVLALDLGALIGGTKYRGEFEERMKKLTTEIQSMARKIILFVDEVHMVEQAKGAEGAMNVSDIIKPQLARGDLQMIGATTWKEYEQYTNPDDALNRRLQPVIVGEPSEEATLSILRGIKDIYEKHHHVRYEDEALKAAVELSKKYIKDRFLPDKAIDLMDEAGAKVSIEATHTARHALGLIHAAGAEVANKLAELGKEESKIKEEIKHLQDLEEHIKEESEVKEVRTRMEHLLAAVSKVESNLKEKTGEGPPRVTSTVIREIVSDWVGKPDKEII